MTIKGQLLRSASVVALVTIISRICGYLRDQRITLLLGTSPAADAFILAFRIPSLIRRMTGEGSLGASFIPVFAGYLHHKPLPDAWAFAQKVFWNLAVVLSVLAVLGVVFSREVVHVVTMLSGNSAPREMAVYLNRIIFPVVLFVGLGALATAILHSFRVFALPAAAPVFFNLALIASSFGLVYRPILRWIPEAYRTPATALAIGVLAGGAIQLALQVPALWRRGMSFLPEFSVSDPGVRTVGRLMGPAFFGMGVYQINMFVDTIFAFSPRLPSGSVTSLYVADRVMQLVLGSYAIALSTALLPTMSLQMAGGQWDEMKRTFGFALRIVSFITIPAAAGLILLRGPIIQVLFQHGQFAAGSTALTAHALLYYSLGLPAFAAIKLITPMYYSAQDTATPARAGLWALGMNIALNALFLLFFFRVLSNGGPALASSLAAYFNFGLLFFLFRRRYGCLGGRAWIGPLGKMLVCAAAMAAVAFAGLRLWPFAAAGHLLPQAGLLAAMILAAVAVYFGLARLLHCEALSELFLLLRRAEKPLGQG
ncbi:MAG: murein biosynthesis integral membrane protein MurJ [Acidobacteriia bacterium]|nr:murein biosynthesis integral membrane protein MurJ [Terriglobia bacterium]